MICDFQMSIIQIIIKIVRVMKTDLILTKAIYIIIVKELSDSDIHKQYITQVYQKDN